LINNIKDKIHFQKDGAEFLQQGTEKYLKVLKNYANNERLEIWSRERRTRKIDQRISRPKESEKENKQAERYDDKMSAGSKEAGYKENIKNEQNKETQSQATPKKEERKSLEQIFGISLFMLMMAFPIFLGIFMLIESCMPRPIFSLFGILKLPFIILKIGLSIFKIY
jgi:Fe2+ transport system protein B